MKEIKINVPEGYEIDKEKSTFECIKFKPIDSIATITYSKLATKLFKNDTGYYPDAFGTIQVLNPEYDYFCNRNNAVTSKQVDKILALNQLLNIAYYCNDCRYAKVGYIIFYNEAIDDYAIKNFDGSGNPSTSIGAVFANKEDALKVISNPQFRSILSALCVK